MILFQTEEGRLLALRELRKALDARHALELELLRVLAGNLIRHRNKIAAEKKPMEKKAIGPLPPRLLEVMQLFASGDSTAEIGRKLKLHVNTVRKYFTRIRQHLDARSLPDMVRRAAYLGLLPPPPLKLKEQN